ncbi:hypothetical protein [Achromobacter deleyi]|uniref:hypothetical protein n=1 Tax=Achromobacter deleyi TaxID=1353891 RepID=UPI001E30A896|nr:hypothetical protein [Achromobacter deleyi]
MLVISCAALMGLPGLAQAQTSGRGCTSSGGFNIPLIPSVNFTLGKLPPVGAEIYRTITYVINYECHYFDRLGNAVTATPQLYALADYSKLNDALSKAGLPWQSSSMATRATRGIRTWSRGLCRYRKPTRPALLTQGLRAREPSALSPSCRW